MAFRHVSIAQWLIEDGAAYRLQGTLAPSAADVRTALWHSEGVKRRLTTHSKTVGIVRCQECDIQTISLLSELPEVTYFTWFVEYNDHSELGVVKTRNGFRKTSVCRMRSWSFTLAAHNNDKVRLCRDAQRPPDCGLQSLSRSLRS